MSRAPGASFAFLQLRKRPASTSPSSYASLVKSAPQLRSSAGRRHPAAAPLTIHYSARLVLLGDRLQPRPLGVAVTAREIAT